MNLYFPNPFYIKILQSTSVISNRNVFILAFCHAVFVSPAALLHTFCPCVVSITLTIFCSVLHLKVGFQYDLNGEREAAADVWTWFSLISICANSWTEECLIICKWPTLIALMFRGMPHKSLAYLVLVWSLPVFTTHWNKTSGMPSNAWGAFRVLNTLMCAYSFLAVMSCPSLECQVAYEQHCMSKGCSKEMRCLSLCCTYRFMLQTPKPTFPNLGSLRYFGL